ncbi:D-3-phosphoglycerate dehydrogenase [Rhodococcus triatomae BKS 15-14]|nr:D-3-phosphoglycerate dehydrogenase [Rhodococcus triatomae BKS 15-14]
MVDADAVIVRSAPISAELLARSKKLKVIAKHGAGLDSVDVDAATGLGIVVANSGDANSGSVAEHAVTLMLAALHQVPGIDRAVRLDGYRQRDVMVLGDLSGSTVGLAGFGNIARRVAQMCRAGFGARVIALDPAVSSEEMAAHGVAKADDLHHLLEQSDVLSIHVPLTPHTRHLIGPDQLKLMKPNAIIVNTARGGILDEKALLDALDQGRLRGAGLDVFEQEPPDVSDPLFASDRVVLSPHVAGGTELARKLAARAAARAAVDVISGRQPEHLINAAVLGNARVALEER